MTGTTIIAEGPLEAHVVQAVVGKRYNIKDNKGIYTRCLDEFTSELNSVAVLLLQVFT